MADTFHGHENGDFISSGEPFVGRECGNVARRVWIQIFLEQLGLERKKKNYKILFKKLHTRNFHPAESTDGS